LKPAMLLGWRSIFLRMTESESLSKIVDGLRLKP
jgi:hypothetical protein